MMMDSVRARSRLSRGSLNLASIGMLCVLAGLVSPPVRATTPPDEAFEAPYCTWLRDKVSENYVIPDCMIEVPNGDFLGDDRFEYFEGGCRFAHNLNFFSFFFRVCERRSHDAIDHMKPWTFYGPGAPDYGRIGEKMSEVKTLGILLSSAGQGMHQWIPLPARLKGEVGDFTYHIRLYGVVPWKDPGRVSIDLHARVAMSEQRPFERVSFSETRTGNMEAPITFDFELKAPAGTDPKLLGVRWNVAEGSAPFRIEHVRVVREAK